MDKELSEDITTVACAIYEKGGQAAVEKFADLVGIKEKRYCEPCESIEPIHDGACLVCGTANSDTGQEVS